MSYYFLFRFYRTLWARQFVALRVQLQFKPAAVEKLQATLTQPTSDDIHRWFHDRAARAIVETITVAGGEYELVRIPGDDSPATATAVSAFAWPGRLPLIPGRSRSSIIEVGIRRSERDGKKEKVKGYWL